MARAAARPPRPDLVYQALCAGPMGHIEWDDKAAELVRCNRRLKGLTTQWIRTSLHEFALTSDPSCVVPRPEDDEYWLALHPDDPWWYRVVLPDVPGVPQGLFVKLRLVDPDDTVDPWVQIVGCHESN